MGEFQTDKAELDPAPITYDVFTARGVVFNDAAAGGTGPQGWTLHICHLREGKGVTVGQPLHIWVGAPLVVASVRARRRSPPGLLALPAELKHASSLRRADFAVHRQVGQV